MRVRNLLLVVVLIVGGGALVAPASALDGDVCYERVLDQSGGPVQTDDQGRIVVYDAPSPLLPPGTVITLDLVSPEPDTWAIWADLGWESSGFVPSPVHTTLVLAAERQKISIEYVLYAVADITSYHITIDVPGPCPEPLPGCDVLLPIPATAVGGTFVADAPVYWEPGELTSPLVTIKAGNSARVIGLDASGQYYKIIWVCDFLWVPKATLGPNYDAVWNGAPLPTGVVE